MADMVAHNASGSVSPHGAAFSADNPPTLRRGLEFVGWLIAAILVFVGVASIFKRAAFLADAFVNPDQEFNLFDIRYYQHYVATYSHRILRLLMVILGPLQFNRGLTKRYLKLQRWSGRVFLVNGAIGAISSTIIAVFNSFTSNRKQRAVRIL